MQLSQFIPSEPKSCIMGEITAISEPPPQLKSFDFIDIIELSSLSRQVITATCGRKGTKNFLSALGLQGLTIGIEVKIRNYFTTVVFLAQTQHSLACIAIRTTMDCNKMQ